MKWFECILFIISIIVLLIIMYFIRNKEGFTENYLSGIDIVYWINLDRSKDRYESMNEMFKDDSFTNIPKKRISAVDGKLNPEKVYDNLVIKEKLVSSDTIYACLLSHLQAIKTFNDSNYDVALILEDDCTLEFKKYWTKSVNQIIKDAPPDWEIIMLAYILGGEHVYFNWDKVDGDYIDHLTSSTLAYVINKKGSNKIMKSTYKNNKYELDPNIKSHDADGYIYLIAKTYAYKYPMFIYKSDNDSTIHDNHIDAALYSKNAVIEQYNKHK
jgi:hypothetical protein